jgi:hypothetical protein
MLENDRGQIWIGRNIRWMQGSASRIGEAGWNMVLSQARTGQVQAFLADNGVGLDQMQTDAIGNELTAKHALDDPRDRAVKLWVYPKFKIDDPPPPRQVPPTKKISRHFKIAMLTGVSAGLMLKASKYLTKLKLGIGPAVDTIFFIIWDTTNNFSCMYS